MEIKCICGVEFNRKEFKKHFRNCNRFLNKFKDFDLKIGNILAKYLKNKYGTIIKFLLQRYIKLINKKMKSSEDQNNIRKIKTEESKKNTNNKNENNYIINPMFIEMEKEKKKNNNNNLFLENNNSNNAFIKKNNNINPFFQQNNNVNIKNNQNNNNFNYSDNTFNFNNLNYRTNNNNNIPYNRMTNNLNTFQMNNNNNNNNMNRTNLNFNIQNYFINNNMMNYRNDNGFQKSSNFLPINNFNNNSNNNNNNNDSNCTFKDFQISYDFMKNDNIKYNKNEYTNIVNKNNKALKENNTYVLANKNPGRENFQKSTPFRKCNEIILEIITKIKNYSKTEYRNKSYNENQSFNYFSTKTIIFEGLKYKLISIGSNLKESEGEIIIDYCKNIYIRNKGIINFETVKYLSNIFKGLFLGEWFVIVSNIENNDIYYNLNSEIKNRAIFFYLDNKKFHIVNY